MSESGDSVEMSVDDDRSLQLMELAVDGEESAALQRKDLTSPTSLDIPKEFAADNNSSEKMAGGLTRSAVSAAQSTTTSIGVAGGLTQSAGAQSTSCSIGLDDDMDLTIKCLNGRTVKQKIKPKVSVGSLKENLKMETGIAAERQQLLYQGKNLADNNRSLGSYKIKSGSTLQMGCTNYGG